MLLISLAAYGQNSFIVQIEQGQSLLPAQKAQARSSSNTHAIRQLCDEPMNLWEINAERLTAKEITHRYSAYANIRLIKENKKITLRTFPDDSLYSKQWQYNNNGTNSGNGKPGADINAEQAWAITTGGKTVNGDDIVVAVLDESFNLDHEDLAPNLWVNIHEIPNDGIDNDDNGYIDDVNGWNVGTNANITNAIGSHGTPVAGIIGAKGNNKKGVTGVNWDVKIMPLDYYIANEANAIAAYAYAYKQRKLYNETNGARGAFVVATNASWGIDNGKPEDAPLWCAFYDSLGVIGILSMGATANVNTNVDKDGDLPTACNSEYLIAVTNLNKLDTKEIAAGYGAKSIDLGAYGAATYTLSSGNGYRSFGGTSGATPHVTGAVALMYSVQCQALGALIKSSPSKAALYIKDLILSTTKPNVSIETITTTGGKLDLGKAITTLHNECSTCTYPAGIEVAVAPSSANITWESSSSNVSLRIRKEGESEWKVYNNNATNAIALDSIDFCSNYEFQLKYSCNGTESEWGYRKYFKTTGCCEAPQRIAYTVENNTLSLSDDSNVSQLIEYRLYGSNVWDSLYYSGKTSIPNLAICSTYEFRLSAFCPIQQKYSPASEVESISTSCGSCTQNSYCKPIALDNDLEWIDSIQVGAKIFYSGNDNNGYGNHMGKFIPVARQGDSIFLKIVPGYFNSKFSENATAYIDWNQDYALDENERVFATDSASSKAVSGYIQVPMDAKEGHTRLRVLLSYNFLSPACDGSAQFGEVEDYCFLVEKATGVNDQNNISMSIQPNPNDGRFTITWDKSQEVTSYKLVNALGQTIDQATLKNNNEGVVYIAKQLVPGHYIAIINTAKGITSKSFVVR